MKMKSIILLLFYVINIMGNPDRLCPSYLYTNGYSNDLGKLADMVSWNDNIDVVNGQCGDYKLLITTEGKYDTRMRIYHKDPDVIVINFRPTQQTSVGGDIHVDRKLVPNVFIENGKGLVHERFQEAFLSMIEQIPQNIDFNNKKIYMGSHSLGGAFNIFMLLYLKSKYDVSIGQILSFAGPLIGDEEFTIVHQQPIKNELGDTWWQIETVDKNNPSNVDGTVEGYNVDSPPYIYIERDLICGLEVYPEGYGMHDLLNYRQNLIGNECLV